MMAEYQDDVRSVRTAQAPYRDTNTPHSDREGTRTAQAPPPPNIRSPDPYI